MMEIERVMCSVSVNPRAGNGILHQYTGNGGGNYPQSIQSYDARERLKISTSVKKCMVWDIFFYEMHILCCSRDPSGIQDGRQYGRSMMKKCAMSETTGKK